MPSKSYATAKMVLVLDGVEKALHFLLGEEGYGPVLFSGFRRCHSSGLEPDAAASVPAIRPSLFAPRDDIGTPALRTLSLYPWNEREQLCEKMARW